MEHSSHLHPEFGLLSPTPRLRRELRIAASSLLFGGIAGALCVSGVVALRYSDRAAMEIAEAPRAAVSQDAASQEGEPGSGPSAGTRATSPESHAGTAARPPASADVSAQGPGQTSAPAGAPASAIAPKPRMVRIPRTVESPAIARVPLGRSEAPAGTSPGDAPESKQASNAGNDVPAAAPEKAGIRPGAREAVANSSPAKKKVLQKMVGTASSPSDSIKNDLFWRDERTDDWSARPAAPASADVSGAMSERAATRTGAREGLVNSLPPKTVRNASSRRNDTGNDSFWRDERTDDWSTRAAVPASADVWGATSARADTRTGPREGLANSSPPKEARKAVRNASSRSKDTSNESFLRDERQDDWRARAAAVNDGRSAAGRSYARESTSSFGGFWDWSR